MTLSTLDWIGGRKAPFSFLEPFHQYIIPIRTFSIWNENHRLLLHSNYALRQSVSGGLSSITGIIVTEYCNLLRFWWRLEFGKHVRRKTCPYRHLEYYSSEIGRAHV